MSLFRLISAAPRGPAWGLILCGLAICAVSGCHKSQLSETSNSTTAQSGEVGNPVDRSGRFTLKFEKKREGHSEQILVAGFTESELSTLAAADLDDESWSQILTVKVATDDNSIPSMLGSYVVEKGSLVFKPEFRLRHGLKYVAVFNPSSIPGGSTGKDSPQSIEFGLPARPKTPPTFIASVFPSRNELPENQLKFYIHFTAPMRRGDAYRRIHLLTESGDEVELPFLELGEELWDPDRVRFTLFFDPGRIKRGLKPREDVGPSIVEGRTYTLLIDADWPDANDQPLGRAFRKRFKVIAPDDVQPATENWKVVAPAANSTAPLEVRFAESLDHGMLERVLQVKNAARQIVDGTIEIGEFETIWKLTPKSPWKPGEYSLEVDTDLEDLAGNSIAKPFEVDIFRKIQRDVVPKIKSVTFSVIAKE